MVETSLAPELTVQFETFLAKRTPRHKIRIGALQATIWRNHGDNGNGTR